MSSVPIFIIFILILIFVYIKNDPKRNDENKYLEDFKYKYDNNEGFRKAINRLTDKE